MKELLKQYAAYNTWAHQKLLDIINTLSPEQQEAELKSSFSSLYLTVLHMWDAETAWWQRVKLQERLNMPSDTFKGSFRELSNGLLNQSRQWEEWVTSASDLAIEHVFQYQNSKRELFKQPVFQVLLHVFNHGTYHRGQLVTMLRQLGIEKLPSTDFTTYFRSKK